MGRTKSSILEKIKEGDQKGQEAIEAGQELEGDGTEIKSLLDGIDTSMDEDDVAAIGAAESGYSGDFQSAFQEQVETKADEMRDVENASIDESKVEQAKVEDAADKFREMAGVTDVGRGNADAGADAMRKSANEYEEYADQAQGIIDETESEVQSLESSISSIFS